MSPKKFHILMIILIFMVAVAFFGVAYWSNNLLIAKSNSLVAFKATNNGLEQEQAGLLQDKRDIKKYQSLYDISKSIVPESKDQAQTVRQIVNLATQNNVTLASITFPGSSLGNGSGSVLHPTTPLKTSSPTPGSSVGVSSSSSPALSQLTPAANIPGVYELPITIQSSGNTGQEATYPEMIGFLKALENNRLTALVNSINITPAQYNNQYFVFTLNINIYIKPGN